MNNNNNHFVNSNNMEHGTPPCQNIMFPHFLHNPYHYQPIINIPTRSTTATLGEVGASVDMLRAQLAELSKRMEKMESAFSKFESSISNDVFLLKNTLSEHATELLHTRDAVESAFAHAKETNSLIEQHNVCIDELADICHEHGRLFSSRTRHQNGVKKNAASIDLAMIRRRLSKVEDFTSEFYEQFEDFKSVKDTILNLSDHVNECDRDISLIVTKKNNNTAVASTFTLPSPYACNAIVDLDAYFSEYDDNNDDDNNDDECGQNNSPTFIKKHKNDHGDQERQSVDENEEDDFEKL